MEDPFVTDIWFEDQPRAGKDEHDPLPAFEFELHSSGEAMLQTSSLWEQSVYNLRYGLSTHKKPEEFMTYQGPAQYRQENDPVMTGRYHSYQQERRRAEYVQRKFEEKQAELERLRKAEQDEIERPRTAAILARLGQNTVLLKQQGQLQQQQAISNGQYPQYSFLAPTETSSQGLSLVPATNFAQRNFTQQTVPAGASRQTSPVRLAQLLDQSITSSPTYRSSPALAYHTPAGSSPSKANCVLGTQVASTVGMSGTYANAQREYTQPPGAPVNSRCVDLDGYDIPVPQPSGMMKLPYLISDQQRYAGVAATYAPAASADSPDPDKELVQVRRRMYQQTTSIMKTTSGAEPTPPMSDETNSDEDMLLDTPKDGKLSDGEERPASPTLSEIIGSETSSEAADEDDDGDEDFNPRKRGARLKVPKHREVRSIGMKKRRSSGKARR